MGVLTTLKLWFTPPKHGAIYVRCSNAQVSFQTDEIFKLGKVNQDGEDGYDLGPLVEEEVHTNITTEESPFDILLAKAVRFTGSLGMFIFMWVTIGLWFIWGVLTGYPNHWQIGMQDGQSIQTYVWDTLLMRQQLDDTEGFLNMYGKLKSRSLTHKKLLTRLRDFDHHTNTGPNIYHTTQLGPLNWFDRLSNYMSTILGSLSSIVIFWLGIFVWILYGAVPLDDGEGNMKKWSDRWQMIINTIVAVELLVTSVFLENIRSRNNDFMRRQLDEFAEFDSKLELQCRRILNESENNPLVKVDQCPKPGFKKLISKYSDIIGTGIGLVISAIVFGVWIATGPLMNWNDNWWLIIGTYTGLVSFTESFVLRCVYFDITKYEESKFLELLHDSQELLDITGIDSELNLPKAKGNVMDKVSLEINSLCSTQWSVLVSMVIVFVLLVIATMLHWSTTGQLIANTPTMIIEGFFHLILIQAHNWADETRTTILTELVKSRELLLNHVSGVKAEY